VCVSALGGLAYGTALLFDDVDPLANYPPTGDDDVDYRDLVDTSRSTFTTGGRYDQVVLARNRSSDREQGRQDAMDSVESLFVQYLARECFPTASYVCSGYTCGEGQVTFGDNQARKADCLVSVAETVSVDPPVAEEQVSDGVWKRHAAVSKTVQVLKYFNLHTRWWHRGGQCFDDCPMATDHDDDNDGKKKTKRPPLSRFWQQKVGERVADDQHHDALKRDYAKAMTEVNPTGLIWEYHTVNDCQIQHGRHPPDPSLWKAPPVQPSLAERKRRAKAAAAAAEDETADQLAAAAAKTFRDFDSVRSLLLHKHPESAVLGLKKRKFTQKSLVKFILESGDNSASPLNHVGGFVVIESGRETRKDLLGQQFAFCVQRDTLKETDLGSFTTLQAGWQWGKEAAKRLTTVKSNTSTVSRTSFHDRGAALSLDAFRFLVRERGLAGYRIRHVSLVFFFGGRSSVTSVNLIFFLLQFVFYHVNQTLNPYLEKLLQSRRDLQLAGDKTKEIFREVQKLAFNGERERERERKSNT
jgi:hypothetical protein